MRYPPLNTTLTTASLLIVMAPSAHAAPATPDDKAAATEARMTDDERFQLLHGIMPITFGPHPSPAPASIKPTSGYIPGIPRLGIPDLLETDGTLGVANAFDARPGDVATALPSGQAIAASFDPAQAYAGGALVGSEARAKGFNILLGGGINLARDWYNGRNYEYLGEDPLLAGAMAGAAIRGTQSQGVISTIKHFALNAQETLRKSLNARIGEAALRESDLLAFEIAIERGQPGSVMCGYNLVNDHYDCGNAYLLTKVLKQDWGYKGWVMSDWQAVHDVGYFDAGLDQQSAAELDKKVWFDGPLRAAVADGKVDHARISQSVRRILRSVYAVEVPEKAVEQPIDYAAHGKTARSMASNGIVLLKNSGLLPISPKVTSILVVGGFADRGVMSGNGAAQVNPVGGAAMTVPLGGPGMLETALGDQVIMPSSPVEALRKALPGVAIEYQSGYYPEIAAARATKFDMVLVFATQWQSERVDGPSLTLPSGQDRLIEALVKANPKTGVVLETGNPVAMPWLADAQAVVEAWYPGQEGGRAIADVLTGAVNPSGHLPMTFPASAGQTPRATVPGLAEPDGTRIDADYPEGADVGYRWFARTGATPLFAFGHGLSYTSFAFAKPRFLPAAKGKASMSAMMTVTNTGARDGAAVPQLYLVGKTGQAVLRLAGFAKIDVPAGQSREVRIDIDRRLLADWNGTSWIIGKGAYAFALGRSASDLDPAQTIDLPAQILKP